MGQHIQRPLIRGALLALVGYGTSGVLLIQYGEHATWAAVFLLLLPSLLSCGVAVVLGSLRAGSHHTQDPRAPAVLRRGNRLYHATMSLRKIPVQRPPAQPLPQEQQADACDCTAQEQRAPTEPAIRKPGRDQPLLQVHGLTKRFGGVLAVDQVSLSVSPGEVVGLLGDNGAGKSTLIKLMSGVYRPDSGSLALGGVTLHHASPLEARRSGIETIYQDLALCENLDAPTNIFLGREPTRCICGVIPVVDRARMQKEARKLLERLDIHLPDVKAPVRQMSGGQRQAVAIARALSWKTRLLIMDEPTAALGVPEQRKVLDLVRRLRSEGMAVILISHHLQEVFAVADRVVVLRRGAKVGERTVGQTDRSEIVSMMVGAQEAGEATGGARIS